MNIDPTTKLAELPIVAVRNCLRRIRDCDWTVDSLEQLLHAGSPEIDDLLRELAQLGYIEPADPKAGFWRLTVKGNALANASAAKPFKRAVAERELERFLDRVIEVRESDQYLWKVTRVVLFGSLLTTDRPTVSDVDIAIELIRKEQDWDRYSELAKARVAAAIRHGREFKTFIDQLDWPRVEVWRFLKSRSRIISLHDIDDKVLQETETKVLYEDPPTTS